MHSETQHGAHFRADGEVTLVRRDMRGLDAAAAAAQRGRGLGCNVLPAVCRISAAAQPVQQIGERLKIGPITQRSELHVKCNAR